MKSWRQLLGKGLRRSLALVCVLIVLGFAALDGLHSHPVEPGPQPTQQTPCWICHIGYTISPAPHVVLVATYHVYLDLAAGAASPTALRIDRSPNFIRPPPIF